MAPAEIDKRLLEVLGSWGGSRVTVHPDTFEGPRLHEGGFVVELAQASVTTNVRRLDTTAG